MTSFFIFREFVTLNMLKEHHNESRKEDEHADFYYKYSKNNGINAFFFFLNKKSGISRPRRIAHGMVGKSERFSNEISC